MKRFRLPVIVLSLAAVGLGVVSAATFDGAPPAPLPYPQVSALDGWDVQVHDRDAAEHPGTTASTVAMHGADCAAPPATHITSGSTADSVFQCANHIMTAIDGENYSVIYLTPPEMVDFSQGGTVSFDVSTDRMSVRDWWDITVSPFLDSQALPLFSSLSQGTDLQNPNRNSIVITTDNGEASPNLKATYNGAGFGYGSIQAQPFNDLIAAGTNQDATRQPFRLTLSPTHVRFERLASATGQAIVFVDRDIPALSWTQGVVQIGHHSYNPTKTGAGVPATWHWDNIALSPSVPFYISRSAAFTTGGTITTAPAPAGAYLRFSAICKPVVDGVARTKETDSGHPEHFASYFVPVTEGSTSHSVSFADDSWYTTNNGCLAKDFSVFALNAPGPTATPTNTPIPPTATNTSVPPTATNTPLPATATPTRTPTATATPYPYRCVNASGQTKPGWVPGGRC